MEEEGEDGADAEWLYGAGLFSEEHDDEDWVRCQKCLKLASTGGALSATVATNDRHLFIVAAKHYESLCVVILVNKIPFSGIPNFFYI